MEPTFPPGSLIRVERRAYRRREPARGEVVVLRPPGAPGRLDLKRVVALPGEEVELAGGRFRVGGRPLVEEHARIPPAPPGDDEVRRWRLGPGEFFVAGDNRLHSVDSRDYGPVPRSAIVGRARVRERA